MTVTVSWVEVAMPKVVAAGVLGRASEEAAAVTTIATGTLRFVLT